MSNSVRGNTPPTSSGSASATPGHVTAKINHGWSYVYREVEHLHNLSPRSQVVCRPHVMPAKTPLSHHRGTEDPARPPAATKTNSLAKTPRSQRGRAVRSCFLGVLCVLARDIIPVISATCVESLRKSSTKDNVPKDRSTEKREGGKGGFLSVAFSGPVCFLPSSPLSSVTSVSSVAQTHS